MVIVVAFILKYGDVAEYSEAMCETSWNEKLVMIVFCQFNDYMLAVGWRAFANINCDIKDSTLYTADEFGLSEGWLLEMQTAHDPVGGAGFVVLYEVDFGYFLIEFLLVVAFEEVASGILEYSWLDDYRAFYVGFDYIHDRLRVFFRGTCALCYHRHF